MNYPPRWVHLTLLIFPSPKDNASITAIMEKSTYHRLKQHHPLSEILFSYPAWGDCIHPVNDWRHQTWLRMLEEYRYKLIFVSAYYLNGFILSPSSNHSGTYTTHWFISYFLRWCQYEFQFLPTHDLYWKGCCPTPHSACWILLSYLLSSMTPHLHT